MQPRAAWRRVVHGHLRAVVAACLTVLCAAFFAGCATPALGTVVTNNEAVQVELMFEHDGCRVYRFVDYARPVYFTDCRGSTSWQASCGRNCVYPTTVPTARATTPPDSAAVSSR